MKRIVIILLLLCYLGLSFSYAAGAKTTSSTQDGSWISVGVWNNGVPNETKDEIFINDSINAESLITLNLGSQSSLIIESRAILVVQNITFGNGCHIDIKPGGTLIVLGNLTNNNNSDDVSIDGSLSVSGTLDNGVGADISGNGVIISEVYTGECCVMGHDPDSLSAGDVINDSIVGGSLPIDLLYFTAYCYKGCVIIDWSTITEINNDYFEIYRSNSMIDWKMIVTMPGSGNSNKVIRYLYKDSGTKNLVWYYRLRQVDYNGQYKEYEVIHIVCEETQREILIYPNPMNEGETLQITGINENDKVRIYDTLGKYYENRKLPIGVTNCYNQT